MAVDLEDKSVLIVVKRLEDLSALRRLMAELGSRDIHVASSANMALNMLRMQPFDLCVVESFLGTGEKSGLQVVEEAIREGLKPETGAFVLITPEDTKALPNDSLDYGADTFVTRPLDLEKLQLRLEKLLKLKQAVYPVESLIEQGDYEKALNAIDVMSRKYPSLKLYLQRLQGRLLVVTEAYDRAQELFERLLNDRKLLWAHMGLGIVAYRTGRYGEAAAHFNEILRVCPESIEAYDWLSKVYRGIGRNQDAQKLLEKAVQVLPTAPALQAGLGDVASENSNWAVAIDAFRCAVKFAKRSCHQTQTNYFGLARCLQTRIAKHGGASSAEAEREAVRTLEDVVSEYRDDDLIRFKSRLMTSETYKRSGDIARANAAVKDAFAVFKRLDDSKQAEELDNLIEGVEGTVLQPEVDAYKSDFNKRVFTETEWGRYNLQGMGLYRKGRFGEAFDCFCQALESVPNSPSVLLNLVQTGYSLIQQEPERAQEVLAVCNDRLLRMSIGAMNTKQQERYRALSGRRAEFASLESS
ncbi:tetratricopeptide repeat protein [Motiliproteus sp. SC1-56]|uniref:tetratricopeptide repeat protein n=1 Tax=Motiliproteus sp. SC1-56 TaxID=2799565 RepID=UPI001A901CEF|nr:tetratricopeptide repeat protein [Motiliproteus sp. SC1-56]